MAFGQLWASFRPYVLLAFAPLTMFGESIGRAVCWIALGGEFQSEPDRFPNSCPHAGACRSGWAAAMAGMASSPAMTLLIFGMPAISTPSRRAL
jgi:hypothetical protein